MIKKKRSAKNILNMKRERVDHRQMKKKGHFLDIKTIVRRVRKIYLFLNVARWLLGSEEAEM